MCLQGSCCFLFWSAIPDKPHGAHGAPLLLTPEPRSSLRRTDGRAANFAPGGLLWQSDRSMASSKSGVAPGVGELKTNNAARIFSGLAGADS